MECRDSGIRKEMKLTLLKYGVLASFSLACAHAYAQNDSVQSAEQDGVIYLAPLFEYPSAPEELGSMEEKCAWLTDNFWNQMDFKSTTPVDQAKLNHAFGVYAIACQYAPKVKAEASADKLIKTLQKNPTLLVQFVKAAEENLYGPRTDIWIDELYIKFLQGLVSNKKVQKARKIRYESQLKQLQGSLVGATAPSFDFVRANGDNAKYFPMSTPTIIVFGDPDCDDCRQSRLRMESNVAFSRAVTDGKINVLFIIPDAGEGWEKEISGYPKGWDVGASDNASDIYDLRLVPDVYLIGSDGKIVSKHISPLAAMQSALSIIGPNP